jgi:hypothetical protein
MLHTAMIQALSRVGLIADLKVQAAKSVAPIAPKLSQTSSPSVLVDTKAEKKLASISNTLTIIEPAQAESLRNKKKTANTDLLARFRKDTPISKKEIKKRKADAKRIAKTPPYRGPLLKDAAPNPVSSVKINKKRAEVFINEGSVFRLGKMDSDIQPELLALPNNCDLQPNLKNVNFDDLSELVIGIDFGTSSTKVVIHDRIRDLWFAVPFYDAVGLSAYLLRARVHESEGSEFSLSSGDHTHRDLKLSFLKRDSEKQAIETVAFLALAFKRIRGWLLQKHSKLYQNTNILWTINIGVPSTEIGSQNSKVKFLNLAKQAWFASLSRENMSRSICALPLSSLKQRFAAEFEAPEFHATTEVTAQVVAFFDSDQFDPKAKNTYMIVDIGAGTVDTCLFSVRKGSHGDYNIDFHANTVEQNGVVNLHRFRLGWFSTKIYSNSQPATQIREQINLSETYTDMLKGIPASYIEYLEDVLVHIPKNEMNPDENFSRHRLKRQTISDTLYIPVKKGWVAQESANQLPVFFCGGGSRHPVYINLVDEMKRQEGISWISTTKRELVKPSNLQAPGLLTQDFDRLSVAYGLSTSSRIGEFKKAQFGGGIRTLRKRKTETVYAGKEVC